MRAQLFAGLFAEGNTDIDFLQSIVEKTLQAIAFDCSGQLDIDVLPIKINKTNVDFPHQVLNAAKKGFDDFGIQIICVHTDADAATSTATYAYKINPATLELDKQNDIDCCKILVAIVPIQETESWLLADKELLKQEIGTDKTDNELGINRLPETIANPKEVIETAIRIAREDLGQRRRKHLSIGDLYLPIGQRVDLDKLAHLSSYQDFKNNVIVAFKQLNLLH